MIVLLVVSSLVTGSTASEQESSALFNGGADRTNHGLANAHESFNNPVLFNTTYIDKEDNLLRVPNKYYEEHKTKKKIKSPKRTIQKIIKKNRIKTRKLYLYPATILPTLRSKTEREDIDIYTKYIIPTTEANFKKRSKKNPKYVRYPMPFQKHQRKDSQHTRYRREDRNMYILKDLDEIEFLSKEKDHDKILTHVQKHW